MSGLLLQGMSREHVGKEVVVAKPVAVIIKRHNKEVTALQEIQHRHTVVLVGDGIAQLPTQTVENGGLAQEVSHTFGLALEHLFDQIVDDIPVVASESLDESAHAGCPLDAPAHRECRQLETGNPAFGARLQDANLLCREI